MIASRDLDLLESFDGNGNVLLTAYLQLDTPEHRRAAYGEFLKLARARLDADDEQSEYRQALEEDIEIVGLYLRTNGHGARRHPGLAIFSCAARLFWRAYPLPVALANRVEVGRHFDVQPLKEIVHALVH
ncbi:MAG: hypothetical protein JXA93_18545 [Anaerolineae bacterium]|nr:hypothetical protein [Anaerolineae bacterium]